MTLIESLKSYLVKRKVKQVVGSKKRNLRLLEFEKVTSVGIIFDASDEKKYKRANHLIGYLKSKRKIVSAIGFVYLKELPHYADNTLSNNYLFKKDVNWYNYPKASFIDDFLNKEFDLLIDLNFDNIPSLRVITKYSLAHCKVGLNQGGEEEIFDFMLEGISKDDINLFLKELIKYLELIRTR